MITLSIINRVDIQKNRLGRLEYHCYKFGNNYLYNYRFYSTWWKALFFLFGYESKMD